jgi:hypothetical protein
MVTDPTAVLLIRCTEKEKLVGRVYEHVDGSHELILAHAQVASAEGWFDQRNLPDEPYAPSGDGEFSINLSGTGPMSNASFSAGCGCRQRVQIIPSQVRRAIAEGDTQIRLAHISR